VVTADVHTLYRVDSTQFLLTDSATGTLFGDELVLQDYRILRDNPDVLQIVTMWSVQRSTPHSLAIFIHLLDSDGTIVAQWDGLGVESISWQAGDVFVHLHSFAAPLQPTNRLILGVYDSKSGVRLQTLSKRDFVLLEE
jgi:hypothetical protein